MEFKRQSVISLYLDGKPQVDIVKALKHLEVNKSFVSRTIARYRETGSVAKRHGGGHKKVATSTEMVEKVKKRIDENPQLSSRQIARDLKISARSVQRILREELKLKAHKVQKEHEHIDAPKEVERDKSQEVKKMKKIRQM